MSRPPSRPRQRSAIAGIGTTAFSRESGVSESRLAVEAITNAMADSGLDLKSIDGFVKFGIDPTKESVLVDALGLPDVRFFAEVGYGGMASAGAIAVAHAAVLSGQARCVVCYRAMNGRSAVRFGRGERMLRAHSDTVAYSDGTRTFGSAMTAPFGLLSPSQSMGMWAHRYAYEFGIGVDDLSRALAEVAVVQRDYASRNPNAVLRGKPLSVEDYFASRMIASPLRLPDFAIEIDGGVAIVVASMDLARDAARKPVEILAAAQVLKADGDTPALYADRLDRHAPPSAREIFAMAGVQPSDVDVAGIYDATSIMVLMTLEDFGFCDRGEAPAFVLDGNTRVAGSLPVNTQGGMLSEGYLHGINNAVEVVRQLRGESTSQVHDAKVGLFTVGYGSVLLGAA